MASVWRLMNNIGTAGIPKGSFGDMRRSTYLKAVSAFIVGLLFTRMGWKYRLAHLIMPVSAAMHLYMYTHAHTCMHTYKHVYTCIHICAHKCVYIHMQTHISTYTQVHIHACTYSSIYMKSHMCKHTHTVCTHTSMYIHMH